jgi:hypothetical protein
MFNSVRRVQQSLAATVEATLVRPGMCRSRDPRGRTQRQQRRSSPEGVRRRENIFGQGGEGVAGGVLVAIDRQTTIHSWSYTTLLSVEARGFCTAPVTEAKEANGAQPKKPLMGHPTNGRHLALRAKQLVAWHMTQCINAF